MIGKQLRVPIIFCLTLLLGANYQAGAQGSSRADTTDPYKPVYTVLPLVYYTPETGLSLGAGGVMTYRYRSDKPTSTPTQIQIGGAYTLKNQILSYLSYRTFWNDDQFLAYGEVGYYRYIYKYYGIGPSTKPEDEEMFSFTLPRLRFNFLYKVFPKVYVGARYWYDDFNIYEVDTGGMLDTQPITGKNGGRAAGLGFVLNIDSRDNQLYPTDGWFVEFVALPHRSAFGSDFNFNRYSLDVATYFTFFDDQTLAVNFYGESNTGDVPFHQMAQLGGPRQLRGLYQGRYRDNNDILFQTEYRWMFLERWGAVAFYGIGNVAPEISAYQINKSVHTYGGGLRFKLSKERKANIRGDVGFSPGEGVKFYLTFTEAF